MSTQTYVEPEWRALRTGLAGLSPEDFREAMSHLASVVAVITTQDASGTRWGFTATSVTSVSQDPPLALVGIANGSSCLEAMLRSESFAVNLLGERQHAVADSFARRGVDRFAGHDFAPWPPAGPPRLTSAYATYLCRTVGSVPVGDHQLLIGELIGFSARSAADAPLLWHRRDFATPRRTEPDHG